MAIKKKTTNFLKPELPQIKRSSFSYDPPDEMTDMTTPGQTNSRVMDLLSPIKFSITKSPKLRKRTASLDIDHSCDFYEEEIRSRTERRKSGAGVSNLGFSSVLQTKNQSRSKYKTNLEKLRMINKEILPEELSIASNKSNDGI